MQCLAADQGALTSPCVRREDRAACASSAILSAPLQIEVAGEIALGGRRDVRRGRPVRSARVGVGPRCCYAHAVRAASCYSRLFKYFLFTALSRRSSPVWFFFGSTLATFAGLASVLADLRRLGVSFYFTVRLARFREGAAFTRLFAGAFFFLFAAAAGFGADAQTRRPPPASRSAGRCLSARSR